jgi:hypothetical protein
MLLFYKHFPVSRISETWLFYWEVSGSYSLMVKWFTFYTDCFLIIARRSLLFVKYFPFSARNSCSWRTDSSVYHFCKGFLDWSSIFFIYMKSIAGIDLYFSKQPMFLWLIVGLNYFNYSSNCYFLFFFFPDHSINLLF